MSITIADVEAARRTISGQVLRTPMLPAPKLSVLTAAEVYVKYENLQVTNSFKDRGAFNKLASLSPSARARGVIAMSAGNHAQAVAYHAARLAIPATIVMPVTTPFVKIQATQAHGAEVVLEGDTVAEAQIRAEAIARDRGLTFVHPYDDPLVMAGQGTVGLEIVEDVPEVDVIVVPVGGAGLIAGIAAAVAPHGVRVVGVEPEGSPALSRALEAGRPVAVSPRTMASGLDAPFAGANGLEVCRAAGVEVVTVSDLQIEEAMRRLYGDAKLACEPAGAAAVAAVLGAKVQGEAIVAIVSGGNVGPEIASAILARP
jgi:threonine dehydratase